MFQSDRLPVVEDVTVLATGERHVMSVQPDEPYFGPLQDVATHIGQSFCCHRGTAYLGLPRQQADLGVVREGWEAVL
jgi:hypothetical protein